LHDANFDPATSLGIFRPIGSKSHDLDLRRGDSCAQKSIPDDQRTAGREHAAVFRASLVCAESAQQQSFSGPH
jgi:hypothetical protein